MLGLALTCPWRRTVLIDEIDKAPRDLPNDLLRELDQGVFEIPEIPSEHPASSNVSSLGVRLERVMARPKYGDDQRLPLPFVIITSNVENQLPDAFLRRCIFWHIEYPEDLIPQILDDHFASFDSYGPERRDSAMSVYSALRSTGGLAKPPATAELLDWVGALCRVCDESAWRVVAELGRELSEGARATWSRLPAVGCLVKLREDVRLLAS